MQLYGPAKFKEYILRRKSIGTRIKQREGERKRREMILLFSCYVQLGYIGALFIEIYNDLGSKHNMAQ